MATLVATWLGQAELFAQAHRPSIFDDDFTPAAEKKAAKPQTGAAAAVEPIRPARQPVPKAEEIAAVRPVLLEVYSREFSDVTTTGRNQLARKLYEVAQGTDDAPVDRFALLTEAHELAAAVGDAKLVMDVAVATAQHYDVNADVMNAAMLQRRASDSGVPAAEIENLAQVAMVGAEAALDSGDIASCETMLKIVEAVASRPNAVGGSELQERTRFVQVRLAMLAAVANAQASLEKNPNDAKSAAIVGRHLCFVRNEWDAGVPLLAKCDDFQLRAIALKDVANPATPASRVALADEWWAYADKMDSAAKSNTKLRAAYWYARAEPGLAGLRRELAKKRVKETGIDPLSVSTFPSEPAPRRVVFVCDATGTMLGLKFKLLNQQVSNAVDALAAESKFNVIFFRGGDSDADWAQPFSHRLEDATPENRQKFQNFLATFQVVGKGTNPLPALRKAFLLRPDVVYFLTDGEFNNVVSYEQVVAEVRKLNIGKRVRLNTIAFMSEDENAESVLRRLADEHNGKFKKVADRDLD